MSERILLTGGVVISDRDLLENHWREDKFGELTDEKLKLIAENVKAIHEGQLYDTIEHVLDVWEECGIQ